MSDNLLSELSNLRKLFAETAPEDSKIIDKYAGTIIKVILQHCSELGSVTARQLLADCLKLPIERPSRLYSALLAAAVKVFNTYPDFHFATFIRMWNIKNFLEEDNKPQKTKDGSTIPPLLGRAAKALGNSLILHPEDDIIPGDSSSDNSSVNSTSTTPTSQPVEGTSPFNMLLSFCGLSIHRLLVTRIREATNKEGRKYVFVTLASPDGLEFETVYQNLQRSPLHPLPEGKRHYTAIGQLYDCLLRNRFNASTTHSSSSAPVSSGSTAALSASSSTVARSSSLTADYSIATAYLSQHKPADVFPTAVGYIESIDTVHAHMHIYDFHSRHLVAPIQRFSREKVGDFVRFIPIVPVASKFKSAIILTTVPSSSPEVQSILREIRITSINKEKGYAAWELVNKESPITELLSPLQLSLGETSPTFTSGYLNLASVPGVSPSGIAVGQILLVLTYLKRGKDRQKRPHVALIAVRQ